MITWLVAASLAAWVYLIAFHGRFWRADQRLAPGAPTRAAWPDVVAVVPARDEADVIGETLAGHLATDYPGRFAVVLVDDHSGDGTGDIARDLAVGAKRELQVVTPPPLASGWTGKLWALAHGLGVARAVAPEAAYVLLTDADIVHAPGTLAKLVAKAEDEDRALVSLMARLDSRGLWGGLLIPAFIFFFQKLYPFPLANDPRARQAAAAGGCVLARRDALEAAGGLAPL
ncbi:MAG: glycosyltransferase [Caulobacterales bacterium]|nr:glycosyltransferase [Caulobacterales bacterium]